MLTKTKTRFVFRLATVAAVLLTSVVGGRADDGDARTLVERVRDAVPSTPLLAKATMTSDRGWTRDLELCHKRLNGDIDASYMEVTAPMDLKDTRFLVFDHKNGRDEEWIYVPQARRSIQVGAQTRKQAFLGSEFFVGDFVQPDLDGFTYRFAGEEDVGGRHCKLVEAVPKNPSDEIYSKTVFAIDPADLVIVRTQFFDDKGKLLKVWTIDKLEKIDGVWTPVLQTMENVQENHWSKLQLSEIKYNAELPDDTFNKSHLTR
jgi:outer membrane lipoprotein-sorting protein